MVHSDRRGSGVMMWYLQIGGVRCHDVVPSDRRGQMS